jgi:hypothetical protein
MVALVTPSAVDRMSTHRCADACAGVPQLATYYWFQLLLVSLHFKRLPRKVGSRQLRGSSFQYCTFPYTDGGVKVSVQELYSFLPIISFTNQSE